MLTLWAVIMFKLFVGTASGQILAIYDFSGFGTDTRFETTAGNPHIGDYDTQFWGTFQHVHGPNVAIHTTMELPKISAYYMLSLRYYASHPVQVYTVSTSGARRLIGELPTVSGWPETYVIYFYSKKLERIEFLTLPEAGVKIFQFDEMFLNFLQPTTQLTVIERQGLTGWKEVAK